MNIIVLKDSKALGQCAAMHAARLLNEAVAARGSARLVLSTGASQLATIEALVGMDVAWDKVEMFHLDEYAGLPDTHPASFRKYLRERFIEKINLKHAHLVDGAVESIAPLTTALRSAPIDVGLIGIGENAHIAFNDPPADFDTRAAFIVVDLDDACKRQQVGEGWFKDVDEVPKQAVTMTVHQILQCRAILSCVPFAVKANAIKRTLKSSLTNMIPATALKDHPDFTLYVDSDSFAAVSEKDIRAGSRPFTVERG
jgi:glucosamine-6-phosphate deaminase